MKISLCWSLSFMVILIKIVSTTVEQSNLPQQFCGRALADQMRELCKTKYRERTIKRNQMYSTIWDFNDLEDYNEIDYPYQSNTGAMAFMPSRVLRNSARARIIDECCKKPCYESELRGYCYH